MGRKIVVRLWNKAFIPKQSELGRQKAISFIQEYLPDTLSDINQYANSQNCHPGDIAAAVITDIIIPRLEQGQ